MMSPEAKDQGLYLFFIQQRTHLQAFLFLSINLFRKLVALLMSAGLSTLRVDGLWVDNI